MHRLRESLEVEWKSETTSPLTWRSDPKESLSDLSLILGPKTYHVHKTMVAVGDRASSFFKAAITTPMKETTTEIIKLELPEKCVLVFENALDFMYGYGLQISVASCVPLLRLAHQLRLKKLFLESLEFMEKSLDKNSALLYFFDSIELTMEMIQQDVAAIIAKNIKAYETQIFNNIPFDTMKLLVETINPPKNRTCVNSAGNIIASWMVSQKDLTQKQFTELISFIHKVPYNNALLLLSLSIRFSLDEFRAICLKTVSRNFYRLNIDQVKHLSYDMLMEVLGGEIFVQSEDDVYEMIARYIDNTEKLTPEKIQNLWTKCQFSQLSLKRIKYALSRNDIPLRLLAEGSVANLIIHTKGVPALEKAVEEGSFIFPHFVRKPFYRKITKFSKERKPPNIMIQSDDAVMQVLYDAHTLAVSEKTFYTNERPIVVEIGIVQKRCCGGVGIGIVDAINIGSGYDQSSIWWYSSSGAMRDNPGKKAWGTGNVIGICVFQSTVQFFFDGKLQGSCVNLPENKEFCLVVDLDGSGSQADLHEDVMYQYFGRNSKH